MQGKQDPHISGITLLADTRRQRLADDDVRCRDGDVGGGGGVGGGGRSLDPCVYV